MSKDIRHQAVLLIHGIGEQRPMSTLRDFVTAIVGPNFRSKPNDLSMLFELRRLTYETIEKQVTYKTCFFESYWAFRMRDTTYRNVYEWGWRLMQSKRRNVPPRLRWIQTLCWVGIVVSVLALLILLVISLVRKSETPKPCLDIVALWPLVIRFRLNACLQVVLQWVPLLVSVLMMLFSSRFLYWLGDAARYLDSLPANIVERQSIRSDGVELLRKLHEAKLGDKPKYERIIVIGHSLGSVIGYDILKFYWASVNDQLSIEAQSPVATMLEELQRISNCLASTKEDAPEDIVRYYQKLYQKAQGALMCALIDALPREKPWRITDFVTLGSPLTYADFLMATSKKDLERLQEERELPTSPPQLDKKKCSQNKQARRFSYDEENEEGKVVREKLHHAAHFALTKWTNLYHPEDPIGGKVGGRLFGYGVMDIECSIPRRQVFNRLFRGIRAHTQYWPDKRSSPSSSIETLKAIVAWPQSAI
jgi:hypothetical protein